MHLGVGILTSTDRTLGTLKDQYRGIPFVALTATANTQVRQDILQSLKMQDAVFLQQSFNRPNLYYEVRQKRAGKKLIEDINAFIRAQPPGSSGIIYCSSKEKCEQVAKMLRDDYKLRAYHYHAGMAKGDRIMVQTEWQDHKFEIIVATVCFVCLQAFPLTNMLRPDCIRYGVCTVTENLALLTCLEY